MILNYSDTINADTSRVSESMSNFDIYMGESKSFMQKSLGKKLTDSLFNNLKKIQNM